MVSSSVSDPDPVGSGSGNVDMDPGSAKKLTKTME